jgi:hypothetical protein
MRFSTVQYSSENAPIELWFGRGVGIAIKITLLSQAGKKKDGEEDGLTS